ncbi:MAG: folate-binding protein [Pseudomonadota bacterium]
MSEDQAISRLPGRSVIRVGGEERLKFLDGLLSVGTAEAEPGTMLYGALLTPQGKIISDMMVFVDAETVALDVPSSAASDLMRRLSMYKLRAAVALEKSDETVAVTFAPTEGARVDPRGEGLGFRLLSDTPIDERDDILARYASARIAAGVPDGAADFGLGEAFPHDVNMDLTGGVDFKKGCFVGQEVVSRMRHRGTARRRTVIVRGSQPLPPPGTALTANGKPVGQLGSAVGNDGLAIVRIDRVVGEAEADGVALTLRLPEGAPFTFAAE